MPKISIIMPVYNTGEILRETIDSILEQTFTDFELIIIDDGSKDISKDICDEYAAKDARIKVFHKANGGICDARNFGFKQSVGEYITYSDHDDINYPNKLKLQYDVAIETGADIVNVGYETIDDNGEQHKYQLDVTCKNKKELRDSFFDIEYNVFSTIWNKLYKRCLLEQNKFDTKYTRGHEDINFNLILMTQISSFASKSDLAYKHIVRNNLSTSAQVHLPVLVGMIDAVNNLTKAMQILSFDYSNNKYEYLMMISEKLRSLVSYMGKNNLNIEQYSKYMSDCMCKYDSWSYTDIFLSTIKIKDKFILCIFKMKLPLLLWLVNKTRKFLCLKS